jgi:hypothetical protein
MSSTPKKTIPVKRPVAKGAPHRSAAPKGAPQRGGTASSPASKGAVKKPGTPPTKGAGKPTTPPVKQKPAPKKPISEKPEKSGGGIFSKLFSIFKKKAPKEEVPAIENIVAPALVAEAETTSETSIPRMEVNNLAAETPAITSPEIEVANEITTKIDILESATQELNSTPLVVEPEIASPSTIEVNTVPAEEVVPVQEELLAPIEFAPPPIEEKTAETKVQETLFPVEELEAITAPEQDADAPAVEEPVKESEPIIAETPVPEVMEAETPAKEEPVVYNESVSFATKYTPKEESDASIPETDDTAPSFSSDDTSKIAEVTETTEEPAFEVTPQAEYVTQTYSTNEPEVETTAAIAEAKEEPVFAATPQTEYASQVNDTYSNSAYEPEIITAETTLSNPPASEQSPKNEKKEEKKRRGILLPFFLIVSLIGNGVLAWLLMNKKEEVKTVIVLKDKVIQEKEDIMSDLLKLKQEYSTLQTNNAGLQKELNEKRAEIDSLIEQAKKHRNDAGVIAKLRRETETLRAIMKHFVVEIDSLNTLNKTIIAEKNKVVADLNSQITKTTELEKDKDQLIQTVNKGSVLKAMGSKAEGIRMRGGLKQVDVKYAGRTEKIKVSFILGENPIAKKGMRTIYIRIMGPNGREITMSESDLNSVSFNGTRGFYAEKTDVEYQNVDTPVEVICGSPSGFISGKYIIDIICEGEVIGQTDLLLK